MTSRLLRGTSLSGGSRSQFVGTPVGEHVRFVGCFFGHELLYFVPFGQFMFFGLRGAGQKRAEGRLQARWWCRARLRLATYCFILGQ